MGKVLIPGLRLVSDWLTVTEEQLIIPCAVSFIEFVDLKNIRRLLLGLKLNLHACGDVSVVSVCMYTVRLRSRRVQKNLRRERNCKQVRKIRSRGEE